MHGLETLVRLNAEAAAREEREAGIDLTRFENEGGYFPPTFDREDDREVR